MMHLRQSSFRARTLILLLLTLGIAACGARTVVSRSDVAPDWEGLIPVAHGGTRLEWIRPGLDLRGYDRLLVMPAELRFRAVRASAPPRTASTTEFPITPANRERLARTVDEILTEELARSRLSRADAPGPGVLALKVTLADIVSRVPPEEPGRSQIYLDRVGEATLVSEIHDSLSGELLARSVERREARAPGDLGSRLLTSEANPVTAWSEVRRVVRRWARQAREGLDALHAAHGSGDAE